MEVSAKKGDGTPISVTKEFGEDLGEMVELFGDSVVYDKAKSAMVVALQGLIRTHESKSPKEVQAIVDGWSPGTRRQGKSKVEKLREAFADLDPEQRKEMLAEMKSG